MNDLTLEEVKQYLRIDFEDDDTDIKDMMEVSQIWIDSMVGEEYKADEKAVKLKNLLQKKLISDMYENRSMEIASNAKSGLMATSIIDKLVIYNWSAETDG
jgi:uncharacterized phage protein (predicted DNA packaging)